MRTPTPLIALVLGLAACGGGGDEPTWTRLALDFRPAPVEAGTPWTEPVGPFGRFTLAPAEGAALWATHEVPRAAWKGDAAKGLWECRSPLPPVRPEAGEDRDPKLAVGGRTLEFLDTLSYAESGEVPEGRFTLAQGRVIANLGPNGRVGKRARFTSWVGRGAELDGAWRAEVGQFAGDALVVLPGIGEEVAIDAPDGSALRFTLVTRVQEKGFAFEGETLTLRLSMGDEVLLEETSPVQPGSAASAHEVAIEGEGTLRIELDGPPLVAALVDAVVGPADIGRYGDRPWEPDGRDDIVVFLADTFRADNLAIHGGDPALAPEIGAFAEQARRFSAARSTSSWTLPAHASMFTGLFPYQHGMVGESHRMAPELDTVAEVLTRAGYRTGAVTDGGWVSPKWGLDHGFSWFDSHLRTLDETLAAIRAFLDADDGRPVFLFVQTYRVHTPFTVTDESRRELAAKLELEDDFETWIGRMKDAGWNWRSHERVPDEVRYVVEGLEKLYRGGVRDLDRGFGELLDDLDGRGMGEACVVFTSDHGEAFCEHGVFGHGGEVYEESIHVPLLVRAAGTAPGDVAVGASLVDLPRTLTDVAGVLPSDRWLGRSLLGLDVERPIFAFSGVRTRLAALVVEGRKIVVPVDEEGLAAGALHEAYELSRDPAERVSADLASAPWPRDVYERLAPHLRTLMQPQAGPQAVPLDAAARAELEALGYVE